jgi:hypothetical protein
LRAGFLAAGFRRARAGLLVRFGFALAVVRFRARPRAAPRAVGLRFAPFFGAAFRFAPLFAVGLRFAPLFGAAFRFAPFFPAFGFARRVTFLLAAGLRAGLRFTLEARVDFFLVEVLFDFFFLVPARFLAAIARLLWLHGGAPDGVAVPVATPPDTGDRGDCESRAPSPRALFYYRKPWKSSSFSV